MKEVLLLGSTGSIGKNVLKIVKEHKNNFKVVGLSTNKNVDLFIKQIKEFNPQAVCICDENSFKEIKPYLPRGVKVFSKADGLSELIEYLNPHLVFIGIVGSIAIYPILTSIRKNIPIALANKEALVMAGEIIIDELKKSNSKIIPVDSEHSAIFQCIEGRNEKEIKAITLTASGGALFNTKLSTRKITKEMVLKHPAWKMGKKITVDSATLMNKGLEVFEAHYLFNIPFKQIKILIHPQAIVHSIVEFLDGSNIAFLSNPDMRLPIQYALTYPERWASQIKKLELEKIKNLQFYKPNIERYPCLKLALEVTKILGTAPAVLNASNEVAVQSFLEDKIRFDMIPKIIEKTLKKHKLVKSPTLDDIIHADKWARQVANSLLYQLQ